jgi:hypothetical protein
MTRLEYRFTCLSCGRTGAIQVNRYLTRIFVDDPGRLDCTAPLEVINNPARHPRGAEKRMAPLPHWVADLEFDSRRLSTFVPAERDEARQKIRDRLLRRQAQREKASST